MNKKIIIANWKSNPDTLAEARALARASEAVARVVRNVDVILAVPFPFIMPLAGAVKKAKLGAQNVFWSSGPYTGEVSWEELYGAGVRFVIVGHSERRAVLGETDDMVRQKVAALLMHGMTAILCVGETTREGNEIPAVVAQQLKNALSGVKKGALKNLIVTYEPVWAISTQPNARPDTPDNAFRALVYIRKILAGLFDRKTAERVPIIYGGSVTAENVSGFLSEGKMAGALVGGASLRPKEFAEIIRRAAKLKATSN